MSRDGAAAAAAAARVPFWRSRSFTRGFRAPAEPRCPGCRYDLSATADGPCPECGRAFTRTALVYDWMLLDVRRTARRALVVRALMLPAVVALGVLASPEWPDDSAVWPLLYAVVFLVLAVRGLAPSRRMPAAIRSARLVSPLIVSAFCTGVMMMGSYYGSTAPEGALVVAGYLYGAAVLWLRPRTGLFAAGAAAAGTLLLGATYIATGVYTLWADQLVGPLSLPWSEWTWGLGAEAFDAMVTGIVAVAAGFALLWPWARRAGAVVGVEGWAPLVAALARNPFVLLPRESTPAGCPQCRYDLAGTPDGACPECGTAFTHARLPELHAKLWRRDQLGPAVGWSALFIVGITVIMGMVAGPAGARIGGYAIGWTIAAWVAQRTSRARHGVAIAMGLCGVALMFALSMFALMAGQHDGTGPEWMSFTAGLGVVGWLCMRRPLAAGVIGLVAALWLLLFGAALWADGSRSVAAGYGWSGWGVDVVSMWTSRGNLRAPDALAQGKVVTWRGGAAVAIVAGFVAVGLWRCVRRRRRGGEAITGGTPVPP